MSLSVIKGKSFVFTSYLCFFVRIVFTVFSILTIYGYWIKWKRHALCSNIGGIFSVLHLILLIVFSYQNHYVSLTHLVICSLSLAISFFLLTMYSMYICKNHLCMSRMEWAGLGMFGFAYVILGIFVSIQ